MGHFTFFSFIPIIWRGQLPKEGQADGFCLSHLKCPVLESCSLNLPQMTQDGKWMFSCLLGTKESILGSQWPFPLWVNPENKVDGGVLSEGVSCAGLGCSYRDKDHCWQWRSSGICTWLHLNPPKGSGVLHVLVAYVQNAKLCLNTQYFFNT